MNKINSKIRKNEYQNSSKTWKFQAHRLEGKVRNLGIKPKRKPKKRMIDFDSYSVSFEDEFLPAG